MTKPDYKKTTSGADGDDQQRLDGVFAAGFRANCKS